MKTSDPTQERASESRARAARTKRDRTRAALLGAADPAFAARGWARTRVEDIASAAGVSNATAYNHFPSKHALIGHVYAPLVQTLRTQAYRDIATGRPVVPALIDHLRALVRIAWSNRAAGGDVAVGLCAQGLHQRRVHVPDQGVLAREVVVGRGVADTRGGGNVLHPRAGPATRREGGVRGTQQRSPRPVTLRSRRAGP